MQLRASFRFAAKAMVALLAWRLRRSPSAATQPFPVWLDGVRQEALAQGISPDTLAARSTGWSRSPG